MCRTWCLFLSRGHATQHLAVSVRPSVPNFFELRAVFVLQPCLTVRDCLAVFKEQRVQWRRRRRRQRQRLRLILPWRRHSHEKLNQKYRLNPKLTYISEYIGVREWKMISDAVNANAYGIDYSSSFLRLYPLPYSPLAINSAARLKICSLIPPL